MKSSENSIFFSMTNAEIIAKILAEIARLHAEHSSRYEIDEAGLVLERLEDFISDLETSLPAKVSDSKGLETEAVSYCFDNGLNISPRVATDFARYFYDLGCRRTAEKYDELEYNRQRASGSSETPNYLNEVADYARKQAEELLVVIKKYDYYSDEQIEELRTHLMAMFLEGTGWQKEHMMKKAIEATLDNTAYPTRLWFNTYLSEYSNNDKVHVIIIKKED